MSLSTVETALITAAEAKLTGVSTSYANAKFTPPAGAKWASIHFLPNRPEVETLGAAGEDMVTGILQIDMNYPQGTGTSAARTDFETIRSGFSAGTRLTSSTQVVTVVNCGKSQGRLVDEWYRVSSTIYWYALIPR
jgi:hypothetical protein